jgi:hypothetical protein
MHNLREQEKTNPGIIERTDKAKIINFAEDLSTIEDRERVEQLLAPLRIKHLRITKLLADLESDTLLNKMLLRTKQCIVRVYVLDGRNLASRDFGGDSDPYLKLTVGNKTFNE